MALYSRVAHEERLKRITDVRVLCHRLLILHKIDPWEWRTYQKLLDKLEASSAEALRRTWFIMRLRNEKKSPAYRPTKEELVAYKAREILRAIQHNTKAVQP